MWEAIRKFGLDRSDLPTMLENVAYMLTLIILRIDRRNKDSITLFCYIMTFYIIVTYTYVYIISAHWFVFVHCFSYGKRMDAIIVFSLGVSSVIGYTKYIFMFIHQEALRDIVDGYLLLDKSYTSGSRFSRNLLQALRVVKKRALIYWTVIMSNGVVYVVKPFLRPGRHMMEDCFIFFGFDSMFETPQYELALFINIGAIICTCYLPANITAFFIIVVGYTEGQLLAMTEELNNLWSDAQEFAKNNIIQDIEENNVDSDVKYYLKRRKLENKYVYRELEDLVKTHTTNIVLLSKVETMLQRANIVEFLLLLSTLVVILLGGLEKTYIQLPFVLIMVGMDCLMGQRLLDANLVFEKAVYNCGWENFNERNMKTVLLILMNAQRGMELSAGGLQQLSYACTMKIMRFIYSTYTALKTAVD